MLPEFSPAHKYQPSCFKGQLNLWLIKEFQACGSSRQMKKISSNTIVYVLDQEDQIISVSGTWDEFASENDGKDVYASEVCGKLIWDFVGGETTRMWLTTVFQIARLRDSTIERLYRCDSPELKRHMLMRIVPDSGGQLRIEHEMLSAEERTHPVFIQYAAEKTVATIRFRCSICGRVKDSDHWLEPDNINPTSTKVNPILVEYTVCEDCRAAITGA